MLQYFSRVTAIIFHTPCLQGYGEKCHLLAAQDTKILDRSKRRAFAEDNLTLSQMTRILDWSKLKAFVDDKLNIADMTIYLCARFENTVGKEENAGYQHFLLFAQCFPKLSSSGLLKVGIVG